MSADPAAYKQLLAEHQRLQAEHRVLLRVLHLFGAPDDFPVVFEGLMDAAMECFQAGAGALYMFDADVGELYFAAARGPKAQAVLDLGVTIKPGQGLAGSCFRDGEVIAVSDAHRDARFAREVSEAVGYEVRSVLCAPILRDDEPLGVVQVLNKREGSTFSAAEVELASRLGRYAGGLIGLGLELAEAAR